LASPFSICSHPERPSCPDHAGLASLKLDQKSHRQVTPSHLHSPTLTNMRGAFVVQLAPETKPTEGRFEGWVEEVDSCTELRFHSAEELLKFLGQRFDLARASVDKSRASSKGEQVSPKKKTCRNERSSP